MIFVSSSRGRRFLENVSRRSRHQFEGKSSFFLARTLIPLLGVAYRRSVPPPLRLTLELVTALSAINTAERL